MFLMHTSLDLSRCVAYNAARTRVDAHGKTLLRRPVNVCAVSTCLFTHGQARNLGVLAFSCARKHKEKVCVRVCAHASVKINTVGASG